MREFVDKELFIMCPKCGMVLAKAGNAELKKSTTAEIAENAHRYDYLIVCNHCKCYVGMKSNLPRAVTIPLLKSTLKLD